MLRKIMIKGFQSHRKTVVDLAQGINVFTGRSDSGKSAVLRAVKWVLTNRPRGTAFMNHDMGDDGVTVVKLFFDTCTVTRRRSKSVNEYALKTDDRFDEFEAMGDKVPAEIIRAIAMEEINWQFQHDAPFMVSQTAGDVAKDFNDLVNLTVIDTTLANLNRKLRAARNDLDHGQEELKKVEADQKKFADLPSAKAKFEVLDAATDAERMISDKISVLEHLVSSQENLEEKLSEYRGLPEAEKQIKELLTSLTALSEIEKGVVTLRPLVSQLETAGSLEKATETALMGDKTLSAMFQMVNDLDRMAKAETAFSVVLTAFETSNNDVTKTEAEVKYMENEWKRLMPVICPLCGNRTKQ